MLSWLQSFKHLIYPPLCLHCKGTVVNPEHLFCTPCSSLFEPISPSERCPYCFLPQELGKYHPCPPCMHKKQLFNRVAAVFDYIGPAATLIKNLKYSDQPYLAKGGGAYLAAQFLQMQWPTPTVIIPAPITFTHWLERRYNQSALLANHMGEILKIPVKDVLRRKSDDYSQTALRFEQRKQLTGDSFSLVEGDQLKDKCVLLIDDVLTTGSTLEKCAATILNGHPKSIYGLTLCRTIQ